MLILFFLCCYGFYFGFLQSKAAVFLNIPQTLDKIPIVRELVKCPFCSGFWIGIVWSAILGLSDDIISVMIYGFSSATFCMLMENTNLYLEKNRE